MRQLKLFQSEGLVERMKVILVKLYVFYQFQMSYGWANLSHIFI